MTTYPYRQSWFDYGVRKGDALGLMLHMAEGSGTVGYLDDKGTAPPRGVSVHTVCDLAGVVTQMLPWDHASGSLNPADRSTDKAYFGHQHLVDVLGAGWTDPNSYVLSMEIEGFAKTGPNAKQVAAITAWCLDMKAQFPTLRGALGHADQTDTKGCPGVSFAMRSIFTAVGGHGLWEADVIKAGDGINFGVERWVLDGIHPVVSIGAPRLPDGTSDPALRLVLVGPGSDDVNFVARTRLTAGAAAPGSAELLAALLAAELPAPPPADCTDEIAKVRELDRTAVLDAVAKVYP